MSPHLLHRQSRLTGSDVFIDLFHFLHKDLPVFSHLDRGHRCSQNLYCILLQDAQLCQLHAAIQSRLTTKGQQHTVWTLVLYYLRAEKLEVMEHVCTMEAVIVRMCSQYHQISYYN